MANGSRQLPTLLADWQGHRGAVPVSKGQPGSGLTELPYVADTNHDEDQETRYAGASMQCSQAAVSRQADQAAAYAPGILAGTPWSNMAALA